MKSRLIVIALGALALAGFAVYRSQGVAPLLSSAAVRPAKTDAPDAPSPKAAFEGRPAADMQDAGTIAAAVGSPPRVEPSVSGAKLTAGEEAVLVMYDAIAAAFEKDSNDCDAMGAALHAIVDRSTPDVQRWAVEQQGLSEADRALAAQRLEDAAGTRVQRAQSALRVAMGACPDSEVFQAGLRKLVALNTGQ